MPIFDTASEIWFLLRLLLLLLLAMFGSLFLLAIPAQEGIKFYQAARQSTIPIGNLSTMSGHQIKVQGHDGDDDDHVLSF